MTEKTHFGFKEVDADKKSEHVGEVFILLLKSMI